jgi:hypothetical protein
LLIEEILNQLGMMTQAAQRLRAAEDGSSLNRPEPSGPLFGHLFIIFNQYRLNANDTADSLKLALMTEEKRTNSAAVNRNSIRKLLLSVFESIQVFVLPDKLKEEARDGLSDGTKKFLLLDDFLPKYLGYFKILRSSLSSALVKPRELLPRQPLTGGSIADFIPSFAEAINKSEPLNLPNIFESSQNDAINKAQAAFSNGLSIIIDGHLKEPPRPTQMLSTLFDNDVAALLAQLASTIS